MKAAIIVLALLMAGCATPQRLNLSAEEQAACDAEGGCTVITNKLYEYLLRVHEWALKQQKVGRSI